MTRRVILCLPLLLALAAVPAGPALAAPARQSSAGCVQTYIPGAPGGDGPGPITYVQIGISSSDDPTLSSDPSGNAIQALGKAGSLSNGSWYTLQIYPYADTASLVLASSTLTWIGGQSWPFRLNSGTGGTLDVCYGPAGGGGGPWDTPTPVPPTSPPTATPPPGVPTDTPAPGNTPVPTLPPLPNCDVFQVPWNSLFQVVMDGPTTSYSIQQVVPADVPGGTLPYGAWIILSLNGGTSYEVAGLVPSAPTELASWFGSTPHSPYYFEASGPAASDGSWGVQAEMKVCWADGANPPTSTAIIATPAPTYTPYPVPPTYTPYPTLTPLPITPTPGAPMSPPVAAACSCTPVPAPTSQQAAMPDMGIALPPWPTPAPVASASLTISISSILNAVASGRQALQTPVAGVQAAAAGYTWQSGQAQGATWGASMSPALDWLAVLNPASAGWTVSGGPLWAVAPFVIPVLPVVYTALAIVFIGLFLWLTGWFLKLVDLLINLIKLIPFL